MAVIQHELARLHAIGIDDVFGVPVNYVFPVNDAICDYPPDRVLQRVASSSILLAKSLASAI